MKLRVLSRLTLRTQLAFLFGGLLGGTLLLDDLGLFRYVIGTHQAEFDASLYNFCVDLAHSVQEKELARGMLNHVPEVDDDKVLPFSPKEAWVKFRTLTGHVMASTVAGDGLELPFEDLHRELVPLQVYFETVTLRDQEYRVASLRVRRNGIPPGILQVAVPLEPLRKERERLITFFAISIPIVLGIAWYGGLFFTGRALAPVAAIIAKANQIGATKLSERIPVPEANDEIRELAVTLNGLLDRLEKSFKSQEEFIADASHQLKTPLSILSGELELIRKGEQRPEQLREFFESARQEIGYLSSIVEGLLTLARLESGAAGHAFHAFQLDEKLMEAIGSLEHCAKGVKMQVTLSESPRENSFRMLGDEDLIRSLLENLLDNAIKYSPPGGVISVSLADRGDQMVVAIADDGPGISDSAMPRIFERFYRGETTRDLVSGSGLGLAIVKRIAEHHSATIAMKKRTDKKGLRVEVVFPGAHSVEGETPGVHGGLPV